MKVCEVSISQSYFVLAVELQHLMLRRFINARFQLFIFPAPKVRKQILLDGPRSCGKSITLAMLVHWARNEGWLVFYVPKGRLWTHGWYFYKNLPTGFWDTPVQAENILKARNYVNLDMR